MSEKPHTALKIMRRKIDRIELQPGKTTCNIKLKLFVDDVKMYKQEVKAGGSLVWDNVLSCDVWDGTKITIKLTMKPAGLLSRVFASKVPDIVQDFYVDGAEGSTEDTIGIKLNSHSHQLCIRGKLSQLNDEESEKFVEDTLPVIRGISRELQGYKDKLTRMHVTSAFRGPTKYNKSLKNYYRIVRLFSGGQSDILKDMVQVIKTSNIVPRCEESLKTIQLWELASHDLHNKVFFIENCKYKTGVRVPTMASGESLTGSISCKEETIGRKWRFMKNDGAADNWYLIRSEDHQDWYAGVGDDYVELRDTQTWWALEPVEEHTGRYIIKQRNKDFCWNLEDTEHGTPVRLKQCANKDESNHWTLRFADD